MQDTLEVETYLAGAICRDQKVIRVLGRYLTESDFSVKACGFLFSAALEADSRGGLFDGYMAAECLTGKIENPRRFVAECMEICVTLAPVEEYAKLVRREADERRLREKVALALAEESGEKLADRIAGICAEQIQRRPGSRMVKLSEPMQRMFYGLYEKPENRVDTGYRTLDSVLMGMWGGELVILAARPAVGKSAFALSVAEHEAKSGKAVHFYSMEMGDTEICERELARWTDRVKMDDLINRGFDTVTEEWKHKELADAFTKAAELPIFLDDSANVKPSKIRSQAMTQENLGLIVVDYGGLMLSEKREDNRYHELGSISRDLKHLAMELKIPVIMLAQLNRGVSDEARPTLRELRDSGNLEENANKCIFLWNVDRAAGTVGVSVAKNRRGRVGEVLMHFDGSHMRFMETEERYKEPPRRQRYGKRGFAGDED